eukprot:TRINITY_DN19004_c6_g1_i1.p1 TRINITY_DN19004_c6_g1~~TRINITY_DN19004_c6_g1_i1.p1  ORF type:complete len:101 (+),score=9.30 TRINITY_DN19004_c6_g1_i1:2-304(+)
MDLFCEVDLIDASCKVGFVSEFSISGVGPSALTALHMDSTSVAVDKLMKQNVEMQQRLEKLELENVTMRRCLQKFSKREGHVNDLQKCIEQEFAAHGKKG